MTKAINRAGHEKRITTHPRRTARRIRALDRLRVLVSEIDPSFPVEVARVAGERLTLRSRIGTINI
jgi:hypothetical protein